MYSEHSKTARIKLAEEPKITCQCLRVPVLNGHTAAVFINFEKKPTKEQLIEKLESFKGFPQEADLPSAPKQFIQYLSEDDRPQVKADVNYENGMGVSIGRLREDSMYDYKFIGLSHNTVRGAKQAELCFVPKHLLLRDISRRSSQGTGNPGFFSVPGGTLTCLAFIRRRHKRQKHKKMKA